jgi:basic membrane protein A and related proteins
VLIVLLIFNAALFALGALMFPPKAPGPAAKFHIGLVFDVGGKNDKSFNEAAWRGLLRARDELGVSIEFIEPSEGANRETALRTLAAKKLDLVIAVGFIFSSDLERIAVLFPDVKFAGVDFSPSDVAKIPSNVLGLAFREHEGSFVMGAIAGRSTATNVVGFVGGMKIPLIRKFEAGYIAGVAYVCPQCRVLSAYAGSEPKAFADPTLGQVIASAQFNQGADIIYHAAGKTGDGVFAAARRRKLRAIGVDSDQFSAAPCCIITSMLKRVDVAVVDAVRKTINGTFRGGMVELGLSDGGIDFVADDNNRLLLPAGQVQAARRIAADIAAGRITVPSR